MAVSGIPRPKCCIGRAQNQCLRLRPRPWISSITLDANPYLGHCFDAFATDVSARWYLASGS
eukprot:364003-Chlamydomonas_euryale.AAC.33